MKRSKKKMLALRNGQPYKLDEVEKWMAENDCPIISIEKVSEKDSIFNICVLDIEEIKK